MGGVDPVRDRWTYQLDVTSLGDGSKIPESSSRVAVHGRLFKVASIMFPSKSKAWVTALKYHDGSKIPESSSRVGVHSRLFKFPRLCFQVRVKPG